LEPIAFLGDYLPRKCGIATFTSDLLGAVAAGHLQSRCFAVPVNDIGRCYRYPDVVRFEIEEQDLGSYRLAADFLNSSHADIISLQHEFGIFGGPAGSHLLTLLRELTAPVITTLHTVLRTPNADQRRVMRNLIALSTRLVVMTERGRTILEEVYHAPPAKIDLIPHGIPDVPLVAPDYYKGQFGVSGKKVLLTFGLLSPNKGLNTSSMLSRRLWRSFPMSSTSYWAPHTPTNCARGAKPTASASKPSPGETISRTTSSSRTALWS
jgi:glycosyltransferase involved in cell wall biosynthesis